jgi:hypothetical protein
VTASHGSTYEWGVWEHKWEREHRMGLLVKKCAHREERTAAFKKHTQPVLVGVKPQMHRCLQTGVGHHYSEVSTRACCLETGVGPRTCLVLVLGGGRSSAGKADADPLNLILT